VIAEPTPGGRPAVFAGLAGGVGQGLDKARAAEDKPGSGATLE
jgi:hypothetical protein